MDHICVIIFIITWWNKPHFQIRKNEAQRGWIAASKWPNSDWIWYSKICMFNDRYLGHPRRVPWTKTFLFSSLFYSDEVLSQISHTKSLVIHICDLLKVAWKTSCLQAIGLSSFLQWTTEEVPRVFMGQPTRPAVGGGWAHSAAAVSFGFVSLLICLFYR